ncbi:hypothetical protein L210DRAFT_869880 [Boletus edulis BED1]|uniref:Tc1-like transposase DDE domain-containing protein n=1 Tax=Boletus edulis BED1 TaxID=1328754 RepID=A0AAD4BPJ9_BOLED|nr:hypothetical protein L210DRAFT_869880 [Boletus edulis BED1]
MIIAILQPCLPLTYTWFFGHSERGSHVERHYPFVYKKRYSMVAALALGEGIIAAHVIEGSFTHDTFYNISTTNPFSQLPMCNPYPALHSMLVMDNACIHHSDEI